MTVAAVILAAGGGSRFNRDHAGALPGAKLLTLLDGQPLITWALAAPLDAGFDEVIVVDGATDLADFVPDGVTLVHNEQWELGQATSLRVGLERCLAQHHQCAVIGLGDVPGLTSEAWRLVAGVAKGPIVFATYDGHRGHPVRLDAEVWSRLDKTGDEGARSLARQYPELVHEVACPGAPGDIDTSQDAEQWSRDRGTDQRI